MGWIVGQKRPWEPNRFFLKLNCTSLEGTRPALAFYIGLLFDKIHESLGWQCNRIFYSSFPSHLHVPKNLL